MDARLKLINGLICLIAIAVFSLSAPVFAKSKAAPATGADRQNYIVILDDPPLAAYDGYSFPSAHTSMSLAVYGFLALIIARELHVTRRWLPYSSAGLIIVSVALSRLYLGVHWFSDVLAGLLLGLTWVALIGIAYDRHPAPRLPVKRLLGITTLLLVAAMSWQTQRDFSKELAHYAPRIEIHRITPATWKTSSWEQLPAYRLDLEGEDTQPMNFQWAGTLETLKTVLLAQGWKNAAPVSPVSAISWLAPDPEISALPILPQVNDGEHQSLEPSIENERRDRVHELNFKKLNRRDFIELEAPRVLLSEIELLPFPVSHPLRKKMLLIRLAQQINLRQSRDLVRGFIVDQCRLGEFTTKKRPRAR